LVDAIIRQQRDSEYRQAAFAQLFDEQQLVIMTQSRRQLVCGDYSWHPLEFQQPLCRITAGAAD
jgi:hypothetical protein